MPKLKKVPYSESNWQYHFCCPGCNAIHAIDNRWVFNQDYDMPTVSPSVLVRGYLGKKKDGTRLYGTCHSFIKDGRIQFLNDCDHELKGQTVDLLEFNEVMY